MYICKSNEDFYTRGGRRRKKRRRKEEEGRGERKRKRERRRERRRKRRDPLTIIPTIYFDTATPLQQCTDVCIIGRSSFQLISFQVRVVA